MTSYPRDLVGYADRPPDPRWPGAARLALNFVVNYEEGGERSVLHGDKVAETRLTDLLMPAPLQGARDLTLRAALCPMSGGDAKGWARYCFPPALRVAPRQNAPGGLGWRVAVDGQID